MTTLLLPPDEVAKIRALKGLSYILDVMILLDRHHPGRGFRPEEIALIAGMDVRTVAKQLKDLSVLDRAILTGAGYVLTDGGRALFLAPATEFEEDLALSPAAIQASQALSPELPTVEKAHQAQAHQIINAVASDPDPQEDCTHTARALVVEVNTLSLLSTNDSSTTYLETQLARELKVPQVFGKSHLLFGESVLVRRDVTAQYAISIFAHVYSQKGSFQKPARVAFAMMRDGKEPREDFLQDPWTHLPAEYLEALNVVRYRCNLCGSSELFPTSGAMDAHLQSAHPVPVEPEDEEPVVEVVEVDDGIHQALHGSSFTPATAWETALDQLRNDMHAAPFETWVKGSKAVRFHGNTLFIGVRNSYTADWLESRLKSTVQRLMVGIMNQSVDVIFVVKG